MMSYVIIYSSSVLGLDCNHCNVHFGGHSHYSCFRAATNVPVFNHLSIFFNSLSLTFWFQQQKQSIWLQARNREVCWIRWKLGNFSQGLNSGPELAVLEERETEQIGRERQEKDDRRMHREHVWPISDLSHLFLASWAQETWHYPRRNYWTRKLCKSHVVCIRHLIAVLVRLHVIF